MRLTAGVPLPDFSVRAIDGETLTPASFAGRKTWIILGRFVACPFCSLRLQEVIDRWKLLAATDIEVLVIFPSKEKRVRRWVDKYGPPFRVAADPDHGVFETFGAETSWAGELRTAVNVPKVFRALARAKMNPLGVDDAPHRMPSEYLVGADGTIDEVYYGGELDDGFDIPHVVAWARD